MGNFGGPRRPEQPRDGSESDLTSDAYEATVPDRLTGFRGTNPVALVLAGGVALGIILLALFTVFHRSAAPNRTVAVISNGSGDTQPAAPGVGGVVSQTPFIPEVTPAPGPPSPPFSQPLFTVPTSPPTPIPAVQTVVETAPQPPPQQAVPIARTISAPSTIATDTSGRMKIDQPSAAPVKTQDAQAEADLTQAERFVPIYRNGRVISVEPTTSTSLSKRVASASGGQADGGGAASGEFVSTTRETNASAQADGESESRHFTRDQTNKPTGYVRPSTLRQLTAATVINARLLSKIESDLPGPVLAQVTLPVYDSNTHTTVVIPAGSRLFGLYDEQTSANSVRLLMAWTRVVFPDGEEFDLGGQPGSGSDGTPGFAGDVDKHRGSLYTSAILLSILAGAESAITPASSGNLLSSQSVATQVQSAAGSELAALGNKILNQSVSRPATIIIRPPYAFQVIVTRDLPLDEYAAQHR